MMGRNDDISRLSEITGISDATFLMALLDEAGSVEAASEVYASNLQELADLDAKKTPIRAAGASSHATKPPGEIEIHFNLIIH